MKRRGVPEFAGAIGLALFVGLAVLASGSDRFAWDLWLAERVQAIDGAVFRQIMIGVSWIGTGWHGWILATALALLLIGVGARREGALSLAASAVSSGCNWLIKTLIARPRPPGDVVEVFILHSTKSFPSGHVVFYVQLFGFLLFLTFARWRPAGTWRSPLRAALALPILLVGLSRVYLGAHWPSDVLGGYILGGLWLLALIAIYRGRSRDDEVSSRGVAIRS